MKVYIAMAKRTPIGSMLGSLKSVSAAEMGACVVREILRESGLPLDAVNEVISGNVLSAGLGQCVSRQIALGAGLTNETPAYAINMVCGSGLKAVMNAYISVKAGLSDVIIAGGTESMSRSAMLLPSSLRNGIKMGDFTVTDSMILDGLTDAFSGVHMGITAENIAEKYGITRDAQDEFAYNSQKKAIDAVDAGKFKDEIIPLNIKEGKNEFVFDTDEYPNRNTNPEKLAKLRPAFKREGGTVTAGNASGINDGASFVLIASENAVKKYSLTPIVEIIGVGQGGVDPQFMGLGPVPAIRNALKNSETTLKMMDVLELNEAFAAQSLGVVKCLSEEHGVSEKEILEKTNVNGGAIALGHPIGASGNRILVTLVHEMRRNNKKLGLASLCIGGGMGTAAVVRLCSN